MLTESRRARLRVDALEARDVPSALPLDGGWQQWANGEASFAIQPGGGLGDADAITSTGTSGTEARAWRDAGPSSDVQARVAVKLDSLVPATLFVRGQDLDTATPSFIGASVSRGLDLQIVRVTGGETEVLASLSSKEWLSNEWVEVTLTADGDSASVQLMRVASKQYMTPSGRWQSTPIDAASVGDIGLAEAGAAGVARPASVAGDATFGNFSVTADFDRAAIQAIHEQTFAASPAVPDGWAEWHGDGSLGFRKTESPKWVTPGALQSDADSGGSARTWLDADLPDDVRVASGVYLQSLIPAQVFLRGQNLDTADPTYYAVEVTRGAEVSLVRVVDGGRAELGRVEATGWQSDEWVQVALAAEGDRLTVQAYRPTTGEYLHADGQWRPGAADALTATDDAIHGGGRAGVARGPDYSGPVAFDNFVVTTPKPTQPVPVADSFDFDAADRGTLPDGWHHWSSGAKGRFRVTGQTADAAGNILTGPGAAGVEARVWHHEVASGRAGVRADVLVEGDAPAQLLLHGRGLDTDAPSYVAAEVAAGSVELLHVRDGEAESVAGLRLRHAAPGQWLDVAARSWGDRIDVVVRHKESGQFLRPDGSWGDGESVALTWSPGLPLEPGAVGLARPSGASGRVLYDDVTVAEVGRDEEPPQLPPAPTPVPPPAPPPAVSPPAPVPPPVTAPPAVTPPSPGGLPDAARNYDHIRVAQLAYIGTPLTEFEQGLLQNSVDVVIPNAVYLDEIAAVAPDTPQLLYSNSTNIYEGLLTDWLAYADANGTDREEAFYHVNRATEFSGSSASSRPVNWFWSVGGFDADRGRTNLTGEARTSGELVPFPEVAGESLTIGYPDRFREINFTLAREAGPGFRAELEYVTAVDAAGNPTAWAPLRVTRDGTGGLTDSGRVEFDPPSDWVASSIDGGDRLFTVRYRTAAGGGDAPSAAYILGRDYVGAGGRDRGVIPAFDYAADRDGDGYLSDAEFAARTPGHDARFEYESRAFYPAYGQMRFATNVSSAAFREWSADYSARLLADNPLAGGLFMDNSFGRLQYDPEVLHESLATYSEDYGRLLAGVEGRISPNWVLANTAGGGDSVLPVVENGVSFLEEFALRPLSHHHVHFEDIAAMVAERVEALDGRGYAILDSLPRGGSPTDPRTQVATLAYYYLLADPDSTMLMFYGGHEPSTSWTRHWTPAVEQDVGRPAGDWYTFAEGKDPFNPGLDYKVYGRDYTAAKVLYKPVSYTRGNTGTLADATATVHQLDRLYRPLNADGSLGSPTRTVSLRNGEGAILIPV